MITIKVEGLQELERQLLAFGPRVARNGLRAANFAGAKVFREAARKSAPVRKGLLKASIEAFRRRAPNNQAKHSVGVKGVRKKYANTTANRRKGRVGRKYQADGPAFYGRFLEFGTSKMAARPFLRPAFENNTQTAIDAVKARLAKAVELAARK
jgi:HK97 gp10 family phage protein